MLGASVNQLTYIVRFSVSLSIFLYVLKIYVQGWKYTENLPRHAALCIFSSKVEQPYMSLPYVLLQSPLVIELYPFTDTLY